ncbi:hypothetical protein [Solirubrobacter soli]|uniref:hypothetical protein n=1 Tax=Solirubrobacter soli TaxID=363832 RepID=UPI00041E7310|nr:hypothetical protein [Solirubrobacter soli]
MAAVTIPEPVTTSALVVVRVVDAATRGARRVAGATTTSPHTYAHIASGGYLVLSGRPDLAVPGLDGIARDLSARLEFDDLPALEVDFTLPSGTVLPFRPSDLAIEPPPTALVGTVTAVAFPQPPVAGARLALSAPLAPPTFAALRIPLATTHPVGATVRERTLTAAAGATTLSAPAAGGAKTVRVTSVAGCSSANGVLALGDEATLEHAQIAGVDAMSRQVTLAAPLRRTRAAGATAQAFTFTGTGASATLTRAALPGDGVLVLNAGLAAGVIELVGAPSELRVTDLVADAGGRWRLDGVRALATLTLTVSASGFSTVGPRAYDVDYRLPNIVDFGLS